MILREFREGELLEQLSKLVIYIEKGVSFLFENIINCNCQGNDLAICRNQKVLHTFRHLNFLFF